MQFKNDDAEMAKIYYESTHPSDIGKVKTRKMQVRKEGHISYKVHDALNKGPKISNKITFNKILVWFSIFFLAFTFFSFIIEMIQLFTMPD